MAESNPVAANVLGTMGTIFWCVQLVPQIWHNWRHKKTDGLPVTMMLLWAACSVPFGVYMILQQVNIPIQIQPQLFGFFAFCSLGQILYYNHGYSRLKASAIVIVSCLFSGGLEAMFIFTLRIPYQKGITSPALVFGIVAAILIVVGFIPVYSEIWKRKGRVVGVNWVFLSIDSLGALFSLFALAAQGSFDVLGGVLYLIVFFAEAGMFTSHIAWRIRHRKLLRSAKEFGKTVDELLSEREREQEQEQASGNNDQGEDSLVNMAPLGNPTVTNNQDEVTAAPVLALSGENKDLERG